MTISTETASTIASIIESLEAARRRMGEALAEPEYSSTLGKTDRTRMEDLHRRVSRALSALHGEARDW